MINLQPLIQEFMQEFAAKMANFDGSVQRQLDFKSLPNKIAAIIGMRRTGKTYFLLQQIQKLLGEKIPLSRILFLNFEDDRLLPVDTVKFRELMDGFYALYPENHHQRCYLFLDEIQNVEGWANVIRRYFDTKDVQIYITGSSAKLLSKEIATSLRGRSLSTEMWPFSFLEYLSAEEIKLPKGPFGKITKDHLQQYLLNYLEKGGFPEIVNVDISDRYRILQDYVEVVIFRDIVERHSITNIALIKYLIKTLIRNPGTSFSVNRFFNDLKSQGFNVSKMTVHEYLKYMEDAYIAFTVPLYSESIRKTQTNPKKIYVIDTGLVEAYTTSQSRNLGHLFENLVYVDLRRREHEIFYYLTEDRFEVDFLTRDRQQNLHLYQVVWETGNKETMDREIRALTAAEKELGIKGKIITPSSYYEWLTDSK